MPVHIPSLRTNLVASLVAVVLLLGGMPLSLQAQSQSEQYFPETGHTVRGEFLESFNARGGLRVFGFPITEEFALSGLTVQYFQRARLEWHPEQAAGNRVQLSLLGEEFGRRTPAQGPSGPDTYLRRYFPETGHSAIYAFLNFFDKHGGVETFGYPITEYGTEAGTGRIVQYFQRAKMEWHPELAPEQRVQLADLGSMHFDQLAAQGKVDPALKKAVPAPGTISDVPIALKVSATTKHTITARRGDQTVYVYITDQKNEPQKNVEVTFMLRDASGTQTFTMPRTDKDGFTSYTFDAGAFRPAQTVFITVIARASSVTGTDRASFFTWF